MIHRLLLSALLMGALLNVPRSGAAEAPANFTVGDLLFKRPEKWTWIETRSSMRKAQMKIVGSGKDVSEVVFFHFGPGNGGGTGANVDRWLGQFEEPKDKIASKTQEITVGGHKITYVQAQGTYKSGMPGGPTTPMPGTMLKGAIVENPGGSVFIRMTGPIAQVAALDTDFRTMVESGLKK